MTIKECIDIVDNSKPNQYSLREKVMWLSFIDEIIINEVLKTHEGYDGRYDDFSGYSEDKISVPLIVQSPYDRLYPAYLKMKIDSENGETARYNNSAALFNSYYMEYRKFYNKTHIPLDVTKNKPVATANHSYALSDAMFENLKRELYALLLEHFDNITSKDKLYDIVNEFVVNNIQMLKGKDGEKGEKGDKGDKGEKGDKGDKGDVGNINSPDKYTSSARISTVTLLANAWQGGNNLYSQVVAIDGVTENSQVDLTPSVEQLAIFYEKDLTFVTENEGGVVTVYDIGQKPQNDYTIQVTITEVAYE